MYIKFETIYHCPLSEVPCCCCSAVQLCPVLCDPVVCSTPALLVLPISRSLPRFMSTALVMPSSHLILWCPVLLLLSIFPSIKDFSNELAVCIRWPKYWSFSFSISPSSEYSGLISFRMDWFDLLAVQGLSRVFSSTTVLKHQFFGSQSSLWSNSHIRTWLLEKPQLWLHRPLSAKWCFCFLICY